VELNDFKRIPKILEISDKYSSDDEDDKDYVNNSDSTDTDFSESDDAENLCQIRRGV
jgi:hypothetical protein